MNLHMHRHDQTQGVETPLPSARAMMVPMHASPAERSVDVRSARASRWPARLRAMRRLLLRRFVPKTMSSLVVSGQALVMVPLLAAPIVLGVALDRLLLRSEQLIAEGQRMEVFGAGLRTEFEDLERVARQHHALQDPALLELFRERLAGARDMAARFDGTGLSDPVRTQAAAITQGLDRIALDPLAGTQRVAQLRALSDQASSIVSEGRASIYAQVEALHDRSLLIRASLIGWAAAMTALAIVLALMLSRVITRPLHKLRAAIAALGTSNYATPIGIEYPREMARLGEKLEWLRRRLRDLEADKDRFLRHVSHELKTPLASLREGTDLLLDRSFGTLNSRQAEVAQILAESALDLDAQIRNLLAYAEWRRGQRDVEMNWIDARILVEEVVSSQRLTLSKRALEARLDLRAPQLYGHRWSLRVSLSNLLSNAVKHAPRGSVIDIVVDRRYGRCMLSVRDRGRGVPAADRDRILQPFVRGSDPEEAGARGTGIGLSIVNETVKAHGGELEVQDAEPGARFVLSWPCPDLDAQ
jgi:two-component system, NtrC family, sensor histidine kinase GlrK